jgi:dipeptidase D
VIVLLRTGSGEYAKKTPVILQAHMDMVYNPVDMAFPLNVIIDPNRLGQGKWIKAREKNGKDSTLGADDGLGVATILALLADPNLKKYPLECLFTVQEETNMGGAQGFKLDSLTGRQLLNLDAEDLRVIIFGSAGGSVTQYDGNIKRISAPQGYTAMTLSVSGLRGGHSGGDINKGRLNAIKVLAQVMARLDRRITALDIRGAGIGAYDLLLYDIKRCDVNKSNAIPACAEAIIGLPTGEVNQFTADFNALCSALKIQNLPEESGFTCKATTTSTSYQAMDKKSTDALLSLLLQIPHGVISIIPEVPGVVETSSNLYGITIKDNIVTIGSSNRSSSEASLAALNDAQKNIGKIFQFKVTTGIDSYPSWKPNPKSRLLQIATVVYSNQQMYGDQYKATVIHAGLECGIIKQRYSELNIDMDCISIGPTIRDPHSPNESLETQTEDGTETVQKFYTAVSQILVKILRNKTQKEN